MNFLRGLGVATVGLSGYTAIWVTRDSAKQRGEVAMLREKFVDESRQTRILIQRVFNQNETNETKVGALVGLPEKVNAITKHLNILNHNAEVYHTALRWFSVGTVLIAAGNLGLTLLRN